MANNWHDSYLGRLRHLIGTHKIIVNSVRAIIFDNMGRALFIKRRGDGGWGMPAGAMELDESIYDAMNREVKEETDIDVIGATLIAIYSSPATQSFTDHRGNQHQIIEYLFRVDEWKGKLNKITAESVDADFFELDNLPQASNDDFARHHDRVFKDLKRFDGSLILE